MEGNTLVSRFVFYSHRPQDRLFLSTSDVMCEERIFPCDLKKKDKEQAHGATEFHPGAGYRPSHER